MASQSMLFELSAPHTDVPVAHRATAGISPVDQVRKAFAPARRLSAVLGFILGGFVPVATFTLVHRDVLTHPALWVLVVGGLLYSAVSVYLWAKQTFEMTVKAIGFVLLTEGAVTFSHTLWLSLAGLLILITINGICATVALQTRRAL